MRFDHARARITTGIVAAVSWLVVFGISGSLAASELDVTAHQDRQLSELLMASSDDFQKNESVRATLRENGDDGKSPRSIDHYAYFPTGAARAAYHDFVMSRGYQIEREGMSASGDGQFLILFSKIQIPVEIDKETVVLGDQAAKLGGEYDGWETNVVRHGQ